MGPDTAPEGTQNSRALKNDDDDDRDHSTGSRAHRILQVLYLCTSFRDEGDEARETQRQTQGPWLHRS